MPVTIPVGQGVATVRIEYSTDSDISFNVLHYQLKSATVVSTGLPLATEPLASDILPKLAQDVFDSWAAAWAPVASNEVSADGSTAQKTYPGDRSAPYHYSPMAATVGGVNSNVLPMQNAMTILKKTGYGQRWGMGRIFVPGIPESLADKGFVSDTYIADGGDMPTVAAAPFTYTVSGVSYLWKPVVTNVPTAGTPRVNDVVECEFSNKVIKSQNRRRPGKGI